MSEINLQNVVQNLLAELETIKGEMANLKAKFDPDSGIGLKLRDIARLDTTYFQFDPAITTTVPPYMVYSKRAGVPVELVVHHSAGPEYEDKEASYVRSMFNQSGKNNYTKWKIKDSYHLMPDSDAPSFGQAQFAMNKFQGKYQLVPLVRYTINDICWHASVRAVNDRSFGVEVCGNYVTKEPDIGIIQTLGAIFKPYAVWLMERYNTQLKISGHKDHAQTQCPAKIYGYLDQLREMVKVS